MQISISQDPLDLVKIKFLDSAMKLYNLITAYGFAYGCIAGNVKSLSILNQNKIQRFPGSQC